jgi:fructuronate reductase
VSGRLTSKALAGLPASVARPSYDRRAVDFGIVHLGVGAFHRAHQAVYTEAVLAAGDRRWGIAAASLRSAATRDALVPQDGLYTVAVRDGDGERLQVIGALAELVVVPEDLERLIHIMTRPSVKVVSLTVTEKGYCHDPATGTLREDHPDIRHDLENPHRPRTAIGLLARALEQRRASGIPPYAVVSCDNLPANGRTVQRVLARFAELCSADFGRFVRDNVACPSTMIDRIVPATTDEDRDRIAAALGVADAWPVVTEPFSQWVIEDHFPEGRPDWERAGAEFVDDVAPYETMKLRLLNGAHSSIAYLGYLAGYETVAQAMDDPHLADFVEALMREDACPTLHLPAGPDVEAYIAALLERFRNRALKHRTWQIAMDGSQKLPQRLLGTIRDRLAVGASVTRPALSVAAWMRYVTGIDEQGRAIDVSDPLREELRRRADAAGLDAKRLAESLLGLETIFGTDLPQQSRFVAAVEAALDSLIRRGVRETLRAAPFSSDPIGEIA